MGRRTTRLRTTQSPTGQTSEIIVPTRTSLRNVFTGRQSFTAGDESDRVDEDDDLPLFDRGFGQIPTSTSSKQPLPPSSNAHPTSPVFKKAELKPPPTARPKRSSPTPGMEFAGPKPSLMASPSIVTTEIISASAPEPSASRSRRQLPSARNGPSFGGSHPIQEEDEEEEED